MTQVKILSISKNNEKTFDEFVSKIQGVSFTDAVFSVIENSLGKQKEFCPDIESPLEDWERYITGLSKKKKVELLRKVTQIETIVKRDVMKYD